MSRQGLRTTTEFRQTLTLVLVGFTLVTSTVLVMYGKLDTAVYWQAWSNMAATAVGWFGARQAQRKDDEK